MSENYRYAIYKVLNYNACIAELREKYQELETNKRSVRLFHTSKDTSPDWKDLLLKLSKDKNKVQSMVNTNWSFVCIVKKGKGGYCFLGGTGFFDIGDFIEPDFGVKICSKMLRPDSIKLLKQKLIGNEVIEDERAFKEYNYVYDTQNWNRLSRAILGIIKARDMKEFMSLDLSDEAIIRLEGKACLIINRSISFDDFLSLVNNLEKIERKRSKFDPIMGFSQVDSTPDLKSALVQVIADEYERYRKDPLGFTDENIILSYQSVSEFLTTPRYEILYRNHRKRVEFLNLRELFAFLFENGLKKFTESIYNNLVISLLDDNNQETGRKKLPRFIQGEIVLSKEKYIYVDGSWYTITKKFVSSINHRFDQILKRTNRHFAMPKWGRTSKKLQKEDDYVISCTNYVIGHRKQIKIDDTNNSRSQSELCDLIKQEKNATYLILVKKGLGTSLRELFAQTYTSMALVENDPDFVTKAKRKFLPHITSYGNKFLNRNIAVLAFVDDKERTTLLKNRLTTIVKLDCISAFEKLSQNTALRDFFLYEITPTTPPSSAQ